MNWSAVAAIGSLFAVVAVIVGAAYTHGRLTQRVDGNDEKLKDHADKFEKVESRFGVHEERITHADVKIGKIEEWKAGFATGVQATNKGGQ